MMTHYRCCLAGASRNGTDVTRAMSGCLTGIVAELRAAILRNEPRIQALTVSVKDAHHQTLALHLEVMLWHDDDPLTLDLNVSARQLAMTIAGEDQWTIDCWKTICRS